MNLKKFERYLQVNLLGLGPRLIKKRIYRATVSQRLRNTDLHHLLPEQTKFLIIIDGSLYIQISVQIPHSTSNYRQHFHKIMKAVQLLKR